MNTPEELEARLAKADPVLGSGAPELSTSIITAATKTSYRFSLAERFALLQAKSKGFALGGLASGAAGILAVSLVLNISPAPLIELANSPLGDASRSAMSTEGAGDKMMSMPFNTFEYLAGSGLSNERGSGQIYRLARTGTPESVLTNLATVFGVPGSVNKYPDFSEDNQGYFFSDSTDPWGFEDQRPMISIWWTGTGSWNYSNPLATSSSCARQGVDGFCEEWLEPVPTPELLPSREEAVATALGIFNATGLAATESDLRIDYSEWGVTVSAALAVNGQPTSLEWYIGWSGTGELSYAGGHSTIVESVGEFETISEVQAVSRLADWRWIGAAASSFYEKYQPINSAVWDRTNELVDPEFSEDQQAVEPQVITLTIVSAERALVSIWDAQGNMWLVPGFVMVNDQGWWSSVISVIEGIIALPEPSTMDIVPLPADDSTVSN